MSRSLITADQHPPIALYDAIAYGPPKRNGGIRLLVTLGLLVLFAFAGGLTYWAVSAKLDGAVIAPASFVVEGNRKTVQHLEGGIVHDLLVKEGDLVAADQVLLRLDGAESNVSVDVLGSQLAELYVRQARLLSEIEGRDVFAFELTDAPLTLAIPREKQRALFSVQKNLFDAQLRARRNEQQILEQRIVRFEEEIAGLEEQRSANARQLEIAQSELTAFSDLLKKGLTTASRVNAIKREIERLRGADAQFTTLQARAANQIDELKLGRIGQERLRKEAVTAELAAIQTQIASIGPQYEGARTKLDRIAVLAPVSGRIVNMQIHTVGGVVRPGEPILDIVPDAEALVIEAKVSTSDIEKLHIGQSARVRLTAFDQSDIPEAEGEVIDLSADSLVDERNGSEYFVARVQLRDQQPETVRGLKFVPGMPADVFINTGSRTAFSYLMQPLNERLVRAFVQ